MQKNHKTYTEDDTLLFAIWYKQLCKYIVRGYVRKIQIVLIGSSYNVYS